MNDLGNETRELLDATRDGDTPGAASRARNRAALVARLGAAGMATFVPATVSAAGTLSTGIKVTVLAALLLGGVVTTGVFIATKHSSTEVSANAPASTPRGAPQGTPEVLPVSSTQAPAEASTAEAPQPSNAVPQASVQSKQAPSRALATDLPRAITVTQDPPPVATAQLSLSTVAPVAPSNAASGPVLTPPSDAPATTGLAPASADLGAEVVLLRRAQSMLRSGHPELALRAVEEHERAFPKGALADERRGVRILALCALGRREGGDEARGFLSERGSSPLAARIRGSCPK